ncbi:MAG: RodZ domain-containing protein [Usitatibacter sp.]
MEAADDNAAASRTLGQTFAAERERQGLSRADAAQRLHMSAWQVEALETGDYSRLPKGTFLRGFVRNYAKVLGLGADEALALLPEHAPRDQKPGIVVPTQNIRFDPIGDRLQNPYVKATLLAVVALSIGFAAMYWWLFIRPTNPGAAARKAAETQAPVAASAASRPATEPARQSLAFAPTQVEPARPEPAKPEPAKAQPPKPEAAKAQPPKPEPAKAQPVSPQPVAAQAASAAGSEVLRVGSGGSTLKFSFKGPSWVEIRDARGRVLLSRLNPAGSEAEVAGNPPFNVIVGNAPEVELLYNNRSFDLEPHTKVAVARFTLE